MATETKGTNKQKGKHSLVDVNKIPKSALNLSDIELVSHVSFTLFVLKQPDSYMLKNKKVSPPLSQTIYRNQFQMDYRFKKDKTSERC